MLAASDWLFISPRSAFHHVRQGKLCAQSKETSSSQSFLLPPVVILFDQKSTLHSNKKNRSILVGKAAKKNYQAANDTLNDEEIIQGVDSEEANQWELTAKTTK